MYNYMKAILFHLNLLNQVLTGNLQIQSFKKKSSQDCLHDILICYGMHGSILSYHDLQEESCFKCMKYSRKLILQCINLILVSNVLLVTLLWAPCKITRILNFYSHLSCHRFCRKIPPKQPLPPNCKIKSCLRADQCQFFGLKIDFMLMDRTTLLRIFSGGSGV